MFVFPHRSINFFWVIISNARMVNTTYNLNLTSLFTFSKKLDYIITIFSNQQLFTFSLDAFPNSFSNAHRSNNKYTNHFSKENIVFRSNLDLLEGLKLNVEIKRCNFIFKIVMNDTFFCWNKPYIVRRPIKRPSVKTASKIKFRN